jgi:hypothetical protein
MPNHRQVNHLVSQPLLRMTKEARQATVFLAWWTKTKNRAAHTSSQQIQNTAKRITRPMANLRCHIPSLQQEAVIKAPPSIAMQRPCPLRKKLILKPPSAHIVNRLIPHMIQLFLMGRSLRRRYNHPLINTADPQGRTNPRDMRDRTRIDHIRVESIPKIGHLNMTGHQNPTRLHTTNNQAHTVQRTQM